MTTSQLLDALEVAGTNMDYAGPESRFDGYVSLSAAVLEGAHPEASRPSLFASCGCGPPSPVSPPSPCGC